MDGKKLVVLVVMLEKIKKKKATQLIIWDVLADKGELVGKCDFKVKAIDTKAQKKTKTNSKKNEIGT